MRYQLEPLTPTLGAEVRGLDLNSKLSASTLSALQHDLDQRRVLFFRQQHISPQAQRDFAARLGQLHQHPIYPHIEQLPEILVLDTELNDLRDNAVWHSDVSFLPEPAAMAVLVAEIVPDCGGDTLWSCQHAAWRALSPAMQRWLSGLQAIHRLDQAFPETRFATHPSSQARREAALHAHPPQRHPVIRRHPRSGEACLYVNPGFTSAIDELSPTESRAVLDMLFRHSQDPAFQVRWRWQAGDVALWDNRITQHYACQDYVPQRRRMRRATILGEAPLAFHSAP